MQTVVIYGRLITRALFNSVSDDVRQLSLSPQARRKPFNLWTATAGISKNEKTLKPVAAKWGFGDDAYFIAKTPKADVIGVADGVGGWRSYGVDPSKFPRSLMSICERLVKEHHFRAQEPKEILTRSYQEILENKMALVGSSTACLVTLDKEEQTLYTANLGDSGFLVVRDKGIVHRSVEQQHYFNTPFQLAVAPSVLQGVVLSDSPDLAQTASFLVEEGDLIVVGTDGLFDNLSDDMILRHLAAAKPTRLEHLEQLANDLCQHAHKLAYDTEYMSPFALHAAANGLNLKGGKPDDITVVLAKVTEHGLETSSLYNQGP